MGQEYIRVGGIVFVNRYKLISAGLHVVLIGMNAKNVHTIGSMTVVAILILALSPLHCRACRACNSLH